MAKLAKEKAERQALHDMIDGQRGQIGQMVETHEKVMEGLARREKVFTATVKNL